MWKLGSGGKYIDSCRWISVAQEQREDVILAVMSGLGDEAEVRWVGSSIGIASCLFIGVWPGEGIAEPTRASERLSLIIGTILHLTL